MRAALALVALAGLLVSRTASADDNPVFVRVGVGLGRFRARQPAAGDSVLGSVAQTGYGLELSVGGNIGRFSLAASLLEHVVSFGAVNWNPSNPLSGETSFTLATVGPSIDYHAWSRGGPYVGGMLGIASYSNGAEDRPLGFGVAVHGGYDISTGPKDRSSVGVGVRVYYASMSSDIGRAQAFSPLLMVHYAYR